jgi:hypothetical protein
MGLMTCDSGYASFQYAQAMPHMGQPVQLPSCGGWLLQRRINNTDYLDGRGGYPIFCCSDWQGLPADLASLEESTIAVSLVTDPFGSFEEDLIRECFPDQAYPFKTHYLVDLSSPISSIVAKHHQRNAAKAARVLKIYEESDHAIYLDTWRKLYANLIQLHKIKGVAEFPDPSFSRQFDVGGLRVFVAKDGDEVVGMALWIVHNDYGYYHLAAYSSRGYDLRASFGLFMHTFEVFAQEGIERLSLGGAAGLVNAKANEDGLARFKSGWSNNTRDVWFCGRVLNRGVYDALCGQTEMSASEFFPAYRSRQE